jgi:uncharacterized membrane protein
VREQRGSPAAVAALFAAYAAVHSALASRRAKAFAERTFGTRARNGLYRPFYMAQSFVSLGLFAWAFLRLPDRTIYRVPPPLSWVMHLGQLASFGVATAGALGVGLTRITGLAPLAALLGGGTPDPEPEAQGPPPGSDGEMDATGIFRRTRHPANWGFLPLVPLLPVMTVNRAVLGLLAAAYLVAGSVHEELRLRARYGPAYDRYRARAPFLL